MKLMRSKMHQATLSILSFTVFGLVVICCGEAKNTCDKARDIQKRICGESNSEKCYPCPCILRGQDYTFSTDNFGLPDVSRSECIKPEPCKEWKFLWAGECIEDERTCDPRYYSDIKMFDNGQGEPGFEEICNGDW